MTDTYGIVDDRAVIIGVVDGDERAGPEQDSRVVVRSDDERYAVVSTARVARGTEATRSERIRNVIAREVRALPARGRQDRSHPRGLTGARSYSVGDQASRTRRESPRSFLL